MFKFKPSSSTTSSSSIPTPLTIANLVLRFLQFVFALTVIGLYGTDLNHARKNGLKSDSRWVYAEVVAVLSALTALVFAVPGLRSYWAFGWDGVLFILWTALFGVFGKLFIHINPHGNGPFQRMKNAVWIDLINMLLWLLTTLLSVVLFLKYRGSRSLHTGRAKV